MDPGSWLLCISLNLCFCFITDLHCQTMNLKQPFTDQGPAMPQGVCSQLMQPKIPPGRTWTRKPRTHHLRKPPCQGAQQTFGHDRVAQIWQLKFPLGFFSLWDLSLQSWSKRNSTSKNKKVSCHPVFLRTEWSPEECKGTCIVSLSWG